MAEGAQRRRIKKLAPGLHSQRSAAFFVLGRIDLRRAILFQHDQGGAAVSFQQGQDSTSNEASASVLSEESEKRGIGIGT